LSEHVDPLRFSKARGSERVAALEHVRGCDACRRAAGAHDPSLLFALLALAPIPARLLDDLSNEVARRAGGDNPPYGAIVGTAGWPRRAAAAAAAVLAVLCGYATLREPPAARAPLAMSSRRADVDVEPARGVSQVIDLTVGETQIVMVYNGDLNL
jgi:hypothetical protein